MNGQLVSLRVRPSVAADLVFDTAGVLGTRNQSLAWPGQAVVAFDTFSQVVQHLGDAEVDAGGASTGKLAYGAAKIAAAMSPVSFFVLRNEALAAMLDQANLRRQSRFLVQYKLAAQIAAQVQSNVQTKLQALQLLQQLTTTQFQQLDNAYVHNNKDVVLQPTVETTVSATSTTTETSHTDSVAAAMGARQLAHNVATSNNQNGTKELQVVDQVDSLPVHPDGAGAWNVVGTPTFKAGSSDMSGTQATTASSMQTTTPAAEEWRQLALENRIRDRRTQADLGDEITSATVASLQVGQLLQVWQNELADLDCDIRRLQIAYVNTFLVSPVSGTVAAVYKEAGEGVDVRDAVVRVEQGTGTVFLVGQIRCHGLVALNAGVRLSTGDVFGAGGAAFVLTGNVVAVKGHDAENDIWSLVIQVQNSDVGGSNVTLPIGYSFDRDTSVVFS